MVPIQVIASSEHPEAVLDQRLEQFSLSTAESLCFALQYDYEQYYLPGKPPLSLCALVCFQRSGGDIQISLAVLENTEVLPVVLAGTVSSPENLKRLAKEQGAAWIDLQAPLVLQPISIPKPWGQEIWYTGIEERGQSLVLGEGETTPLPWVLSVAPQRLTKGLEQQVTLLKILDPLPEEVYGDLYFEMHEEKQEVYVVTHIDEAAWPSGEGGIRFGFDAAKRAQFKSDQEFKAAYLAAVKDYEKVRRDIDSELDKKRSFQGIALDAPVDAATLKGWQSGLDSSVLENENTRRQQMESFSAIKPLALGDVVKVPCFTPHSLLHGVRTVEFQTPVYERKILAFGQKVLTQPHWDTEEALGKLNIQAPEPAPLALLSQTDTAKIEQVVDFDDFEVHRYTLTGCAQISLPDFGAYSLMMVVSGELQQDNSTLLPEMACLLPSSIAGKAVVNRSNSEAIFLLALPKEVSL